MSDLRNHSFEEAVGLLRCRPRYLEDNLSRFPHQKIGIEVVFDDDEIRAIKDMHRVRPFCQQSEPKPDGPEQMADGSPSALTLANIRPKRAS